LKALVQASQSPQIKIDSHVVKQARDGLVALPLSFEPFFIAAKAEEQAGKHDRALRLMEEARRRRPNYTATRAQLVVYYGRNLDYPASLAEIDYVLRRSQAAKERLLPEIVKIVSKKEGREALAPLLAGEPSWRQEFFYAAQAQDVDPEDASALVSLIRARKPRGDMLPEAQFLIHALIGSGEYTRAKAVWTGALGNGARPTGSVFDPRFKGLPAPPPFHWVLQDNEAGRASIAQSAAQGSGLEVELYAGRSIAVAEQMLVIAPGRHRLETVAQSENPVTSGRIFWRLACLSDDRELARLDLTGVKSRASSHATVFNAPGSGCPAQRLQLFFEAGEVARPASLRIISVSVSREQ
jgi:hypothetical protein